MIERADPTPQPDDAVRVEQPTQAPQPSTTRRASGRKTASPMALDELILQAKLAVGPAGDAYEREADEVAARVVVALRSSGGATDANGPRAQRSATVDSSDATPEIPSQRIRRIQRSENTAMVGAQGGELDADTDRMLRASRSGGAPLPARARSTMESAFGADFGAVRVHAGATSTALNNRIQAKAFTTGNDIYFRDGLPDVGSTSGQQLLAHELTHSIQQGAATARVQRSGLGDWVRGKLGWSAGAAPAPTPATATASVPVQDPMQKVHDEFMQRISSLQGEIPQLKGQDVAATGEALWAAYAGTISGSKGMSGAGGEVDLGSEGLSNKVPESAPGRRDNSATNPMYYNEGPAAPAAEGQQLQQGSYKTNMSESFNLLTNALKGLSQLQFDKYQTFAFWNSPGAKDVAVAAKGGGVLALESSAIGGLFDGFGSYEEFSRGIESTSWDPQLWAELSRAYASMVMDAIVKDPSKRIVVICGLGFDNPGYNIWNSIESLTLKLGAERSKMVEQDLLDATTYLGVAGHLDGGKPVVDMTSSCAGVAGTWVSTTTAADMVVKQQEQAQRGAAAPV